MTKKMYFFSVLICCKKYIYLFSKETKIQLKGKLRIFESFYVK